MIDLKNVELLHERKKGFKFTLLETHIIRKYIIQNTFGLIHKKLRRSYETIVNFYE